MTFFRSISLTGKIVTGFARLPFWAQWSIFTAFSWLLYIPIIHNSFLNDDFYVIKKLVLDKQLNTDGFFRPLSDITLYLTYLVCKLNPMPYYLTGIILHALNALLIFHFCLRRNRTIEKNKQQFCALMAALLFLTYPFHNESVAWILGRGALMANTMGMAALLMLTYNAERAYKMIVVCTCYFIGLAAYETIIVLPVMVLVYVLMQKQERSCLALWSLVLGATLLLHITVRVWISGSLTGNYGSGFLNGSVPFYLSNILKASGRIALPPADHSYLLIALFCIVLSVSVYVMIRFWKQHKNNPAARDFMTISWAFFLIAMLIPFMTGVSTRTSESDRFLHFPSYFFCILLAFIIMHIIRKYRWQVVAFSAIICYQVFFLEMNNLNWQKASAAVREIIDIVARQRPGKKIYVANLPDEIDGAFVFRNGFREALLLNNLDTANVVVVSRLIRDDELNMPEVIHHQKQPDNIFIPPFVQIEKAADSTDHAFQKNSIRHLHIAEGSRIVYWNRKSWVRLFF